MRQRNEPGIHPAVNDRVVHGVTHGEPVANEIDMLYRLVVRDVWTQTLHHKVDVLWQPAYGENHHDEDHHLYNLHAQHQHYAVKIPSVTDCVHIPQAMN